MKKLSGLLIAGALATMIGCSGEKAAEQVQTVDWYQAHDSERATVLAACKNNPGELSASPNCVNASAAQRKVTWGSRGSSNRTKPLTAEQMKNKP